jgi:hypothetical protein
MTMTITLAYNDTEVIRILVYLPVGVAHSVERSIARRHDQRFEGSNLPLGSTKKIPKEKER